MPVVEDYKAGIFGTNYSYSQLPQAQSVSAPSPGSLDPKDARNAVNKINSGSVKKEFQIGDAQFASSAAGTDWRVRVSISPNATNLLYNDPSPSILSPLKNTNGVIFPYVPQLTIQHSARYNNQNLTHTNYANYFYESSEVSAIQITADFTVQNTSEAEYFMAALYFFRAATKMFYGNSGIYQGSPPPILYLDGYGAHYLPHVPCVLTQFSHTMPSDVDYMEVQQVANTTTTENKEADGVGTIPGTTSPANPGGVRINYAGAAGDSVKNVLAANKVGGKNTTTTVNKVWNRVPTASSFSLTLQPVYSRSSQRRFNYNDFSQGKLITGPTGYEGFL